MKVLTAHQPAYLPWLGLFHKIAVSDKFFFLEQVQFITQNPMSRNFIRNKTDKVLMAVPVKVKDHLNCTIKDIAIAQVDRWQKKQWNSILLNYSKAKYFKQYADFWEDLYKREWNTLADLNFYMLQWHIDTLGIKTEIIRDKEAKFDGVKSERLIDICKRYDCDAFLFGKGGKEYADHQLFKNNSMKISFQEYNHPEYNQTWKPFIPYLACIDLIFNEGPNSLDILMSGNKSKYEMEYF